MDYRAMNLLNRRTTSLVKIELERQGIEDREYAKIRVEMYEYFEELKIANILYRDRYKALSTTGGPLWNEELSVGQREALDCLKLDMHMDIGQGTPFRTVAILSNLGIFPNYSGTMVMKALMRSHEDPIAFLKDLYITNHGVDPTEKLENYELEQKLLLSGIVHLELLKLIDDLNASIPCGLSKHSLYKRQRKMKWTKKSPYLLKPMRVPFVKTNLYSPPAKPKPAPPLCNSFITRFGLFSSDNIYDNTRSKRKQEVTTPEVSEENNKPVVVVEGAENFQGYPTNPCLLACGCCRWFSGIVRYIIRKREREEQEKLEAIRREEEAKKAKMLEMRSKRIKKMKKPKNEDLEESPTARKKEPSIYPKQTMVYPIGVNEFLLSVLEEIPSDKYYVLSLPDMHKLPKLQEWARFRLKGAPSRDEMVKMMNSARLKWQILCTQKLRIRPPVMPYSKEQLFSMTWDSRGDVNRLAKDLREKYYKKTKRALIQIGQVWWNTMDAEKVHNKTFRSVFFSYLPAREMEIFMVKYG